MGDVFLHMAFARRLRHATGLHPLAVQTALRNASAVAFGASLPFLPSLEQKKGGFFRKLFGGGASDDKWATHFTSTTPKGDFALALLNLNGNDAPGSMMRLALAMGALSSEILRTSTLDLFEGMDAPQASAQGRAIARLWLQQVVPQLSLLGREWQPVIGLHENQRAPRLVSAVQQASQVAFGSAPQPDVWPRWLKGLSATMAAAGGGLPAETSVTSGAVEPMYRDKNVAERLADAETWCAYLFNRLAESFMRGEPDREQLQSLLCDASGALRELPSKDALDGADERYLSAMADLREEHQERGRNAEAAFQTNGLLDELPALPPLPPEDGAAGDAPASDATPPPPPPATPAMGVSAAEAKQALDGVEASDDNPFDAPQNTQIVEDGAIETVDEPVVDASNATPPPPPAPAAPTSTQQLSAADIEAEIVDETEASADAAEPAPPTPPPAPAPAAPTSTQQISAADIEAELVSSESAAEAPPAAAAAGDAAPPSPPPAPAPAAPTSTQQISAADIEAELVSSESATEAPVTEAPVTEALAADAAAAATPPPAPAPAAPTSTQQISAADIEAELVSSEPAAPAAGATPPTPPPAPPAPTSTQQISAADIEAELVSSEPAAPPPPAPAPAAPTSTQQISAADIEAELVEASPAKD